MRSILLPLMFLAACEPMQYDPELVGKFAGVSEVQADSGDEGVSFIRWQLPADYVANAIAFDLHVSAGSPHDVVWVNDSYKPQRVQRRPVRTDVQQNIELCWVELLTGEVVSFGAVPDTNGTIDLGLAYGKFETTDTVELRCDISEDAKPLTIGVAAGRIRVWDPSNPSRYPYGSVRTTVTIR